MSYPLSFRKKVLSDWESGTSVKDLIHRYKISTSTLYSWKVSLEPKKHWNQSPRKITDESLLDDIKLYPDACQHERAARLNCSQSGIYKALKRLNLTQKNHETPPNN